MSVQKISYWVLIVWLLAVLCPESLRAAQRDFTPRFTANDTGDIAFVGNTLMTLGATTSGGTLTAKTISDVQQRVTTGTSANNNSYFMEYVNIDSLSFQGNSSSARLNLPAGSTILWAGLYWGANTQVAGSGNPSINNSYAARNRIKFKTPASGAQVLTATQTDEVALSGDTTNYGHPYSSHVEITNLVKSGGNGVYTAGEVLAARGVNRYAVWTMVVVYRAPGMSPKNLTVFDGFRIIGAGVSGGNTISTIDIPISGFIAPATGPVNVKLGVMSYEGDEGYSGDALLMGPTTGSLNAISDTRNPSNNFANSTISYLGSYATTGDPGYPEEPKYLNQLGVDADILAAPTGAVLNNGTSAVVRFTTNQDAYYPSVLTTAIDLFAPQVVAEKTVADSNGDNVTPGDILSYTITFRNRPESELNGDSTKNTVLEDILPEEVTYVPGSLKVVRVGQTSAEAMTDIGDDDEAEISTVIIEGKERQKITVRLGHPYDESNHHSGTGSPGGVGTSGGVVKQGEKAEIHFDVRVKLGTKDGVEITNEATIEYHSLAKGIAFVASVAPVTVSNSKVISGVVFEDVQYGGGAGRGPLLAPTEGPAGTLPFPAGAQPIPGARVELYGPEEGAPSGAPIGLIEVATTDANGLYSFPNINNTGPNFEARDYIVRIVTGTFHSTRGSAAGLIPVQTYQTTTEVVASPEGDITKVIAVTDKVGGENPGGADVAAQMTIGQPLPANAQNLAYVRVAGADLLRVDFGFNFDTVVNPNDHGQGSLRQAILNANALPNTGLTQTGLTAGIENIIFMIPNGSTSPGLRSAFNFLTDSGGAAKVSLTSALPAISEPLVIDATRQPGYGSTPVVWLNGATAGPATSGLAVSSTGQGSSIIGLSIGGFTANGISIDGGGNNQIKGNFIGIDPSRVANGNAGSGISITNASANIIGGSNNGDPNIIAHNGSSTEGGIAITSGNGNTISRNAIYQNRGLGIDLGTPGVNPNPSGGGSSSTVNNGVNYPVFEEINLQAGTVKGHIGKPGGSTGYSGATIEIFLAEDDGDQNGRVYTDLDANVPHGEGKTFLASSLSVDANGKFSGTVSFNGTTTGSLTATTTFNGNTSEFAPNEVMGGATLSGFVYEDLNLNQTYDTSPAPEPGPGSEHPLFAKLISGSETVASQTVTVDPATGGYHFEGILPGDYTIVIHLDDEPDNITPAYPQGWNGTEKPNGSHGPFTVALNSITGINFGFTKLPQLTGSVFLDTGTGSPEGSANNGLRESGEAGINGVQIQLILERGGTDLPSTASAITAADGTFSITLPAELQPGDGIKLIQGEIPHHLSTGAGQLAPARSFDRATRTLSFIYQTDLPPEAFSGLDFGNIPPSTLDTDGQQNGLPGSIIFFPHTFTAGSDGVVTFSTTAQADPNLSGWAETLFLDKNTLPGGGGQPDTIGDGMFTPEHDTAITGPITVKAGEKVKILIKEFIPIGAPYDARNIITVTAAMTYTHSDHSAPEQTLLTAQLQRTDLAIVGDSALELIKKVDKEQAKPGEVLTYTLIYKNNGPTPLTTVVIHDTTPEYTAFFRAPDPIIPNALEESLTIQKETPEEGASGPLKWTFDGPLPSGVTGEVIFEVKVRGGSAGTPPPPAP